jgi:hypothetical protein
MPKLIRQPRNLAGDSLAYDRAAQIVRDVKGTDFTAPQSMSIGLSIESPITTGDQLLTDFCNLKKRLTVWPPVGGSSFLM